ncbi:Acyl_transf_3 domain-containing protein [Caenorhabditis elegans]|uniref:Acyl_transf_3 domain-containing protein n=1 Tax=Caenorhabditis elegans TaxID=6239 RepID=O18127_CAEEL|nr:Acyl_transf_3 domain-containing protein [Caenorhabditis elegans]CAB05286.1 Acyl_transf_3 domain-containing protein [Caenorhabditis elegans]|eukprot:NP_502643.1 O-ACyltransferase homolog [Caenorhabditis elegans]
MKKGTNPHPKRSDLQGIRGFAIISVLGFHYFPKYFPNGYLGVDQFFVLSGFLMSMLLNRTRKLPILTILSDFYIRRFKRILPLYFMFIFGSICALYTCFPNTAIFLNQSSAQKALIFESNRPHTGEENYFEKLSIASDLFTHTWSLSVEIQFYIIVPVIFIIGNKFKGASKYGYYAILALLSFILFASYPPPQSFNSVFARTWQFLIGMIAFLCSKPSRIVETQDGNSMRIEEQLKQCLLKEGNSETHTENLDNLTKTWNLISKYMILMSFTVTLILPCPLESIFVRPFFTIFTGVLILLSVEDIILNSRLLIYLGNISYSLYLIHWPMYAYVKLTFGDNNFILAETMLVSIFLAAIVHESYEKWYLKQSNSTVCILIIVLFISSTILINKDEIGQKNQHSTSGKSGWPRLDALNDNMTFDDAERMNAYWNQHDHMAPELQEPNCIKMSQNHERWCQFKENGTEYHIALFGNSYTKNHHKMFIQECKHRAYRISMDDETGCEPLTSPTDNAACIKKLPEFVEFIAETQPDYAFMFTRFFAAANPYNITENDLEHDRTYLEMRSQLRKMLPNIKKKIFILDSIPRVHPEQIDTIAKNLKRKRKTMEEINKSLYNPSGFERGRRRHAELLEKECNSKCELIDYLPEFWNKTMNAFQYFDARGFSYFTSPFHISAHGIEHVRHIYTDICNRL